MGAEGSKLASWPRPYAANFTAGRKHLGAQRLLDEPRAHLDVVCEAGDAPAAFAICESSKRDQLVRSEPVDARSCGEVLQEDAVGAAG